MPRRGLALALSIAFSLIGCIGATRLPERTRGQQGPTQKINLDFLQSGKTPRTEVAEKLKPIDAGVKSDRFFVGRWDTSKWGGWVFLVGLGGATGGASRLWRDTNLLIEFDDSGVVKTYETFPDKLLLTKLDPVVNEAVLPAEDRMDVSVCFDRRFYMPASLHLSVDGLEFTETRHVRKPFHFLVPRGRLTHIDGGTVTENGDVVHVVEVLHFSDKLKSFGGPRTKEVWVTTTLPQMITLLRYGRGSVRDQ